MFQPEQLDIYWENLVLALIGETIDEGDEICGCRVVDKSAKKGSLYNHTDKILTPWHLSEHLLTRRCATANVQIRTVVEIW